MEHESWPTDRVALASLVLRTITAIDARGEAKTRALLEMLLSAAWGRRTALDH